MTAFGVRHFRRLLLAGSFSVLAEFLMGFLGTLLSGRWLGETALAGVSLMSPVFTASVFVASLLGTGMGVNYALSRGRGAVAEANRCFSSGLAAVVGCGVAMMTLVGLGFPWYLRFIGADATVSQYALAYLRWYLPVLLLEPLAVQLLNCCYADGDDRLCYCVYGLQLVVNLGVSLWLLSRGCGVVGCAVGAICGYAAAALVASGHFFRKLNTFRLSERPSLRMAGRIVATAFGDASGFLCESLFGFTLSKIFIGNFGSSYLPLMSVALFVWGVLDVFNGIGVAAQPIVAVYVGEKNTLGVRRIMKDALKWCVGEGVLAAALVWAFPEAIPALMGIDDVGLATEARTVVRMMSIGFIGISLVDVLNGYYMLIGRRWIATAFSLVNGWLSPVVCLLVFTGVGLSGTWWALGLSPLLAVLFLAAALSWRYGWRRLPFLLPAERDEKIRMFDLRLEPTAIVKTAEKVGAAIGGVAATRARLMTEEVLMTVRDRAKGHPIHAEVTVDLNEGKLLTIRDDGEIFDITDANARVNSLRTFLVASVMERQASKANLVTTGFNRNVFRF